MPLLAISLLISTLFSAVLVKFDNNNHKSKQPISNRRHNGGRNGLLNINKDLIDQQDSYPFSNCFLIGLDSLKPNIRDKQVVITPRIKPPDTKHAYTAIIIYFI